MGFPLLGRWENADTGEVLLERLYDANTFWQRFRGLQFSPPLARSSGLLLRNCRSVHTMWMRFSIDLYFLSEALEVVEICADIPPWRIKLPEEKQVAHVIEVTAGRRDYSIIGSKTKFVKHEKHLE